MDFVDLAAADPVAAVIPYLLAHDRVTAALGAADRVSGYSEPPYPRLRITDPSGVDRGLRWLLAPVIQIEALGDLDGRPGKAQLRRILYVALSALMQLPEIPTAPGDPVITGIESAGGGGWAPLPTGQPRYIATVTVFMHPPQS